MTHISFVSMWFTGSLALVGLSQTLYFYFVYRWRYFIIFNVGFGLLVCLLGVCILVESPMHLLFKGDLMQAVRSLERIKKFNGLGTRGVPSLYDINQKIRMKLSER